MIQEGRIDFWRKVKPGDNIILGDLISRRQRMAEGKGPTPESYSVAELLIIKNSLGEWRFFRLTDNELFLLVKTVDKFMDFAVYEPAADFDPVTRQEALEKGFLFLFVPPPPEQLDGNGVFTGDINSLRFAPDLSHDNITYAQKPQGEQNGPVSIFPPRSGVTNWQATLVEFAAAADETAEISLAMIAEIGEATNGVIKILKGRPLKLNDVKVMQQE